MIITTYVTLFELNSSHTLDVISRNVDMYNEDCSLGMNDRRAASCRSKTKSFTESGKGSWSAIFGLEK